MNSGMLIDRFTSLSISPEVLQKVEMISPIRIQHLNPFMKQTTNNMQIRTLDANESVVLSKSNNTISNPSD